MTITVGNKEVLKAKDNNAEKELVAAHFSIYIYLGNIPSNMECEEKIPV